MPRIPVAGIAQYGIVSDEPDHKQPPEAWTNARNVRFIDGKAVRFSGDTEVMDAEAAPAHLNSIQTAGGSYWLHATAEGAGSDIYVYNSGVLSNVSKVGGYSADNPEDWNSVVFQGIPIFNNSNDDPQYWASIDPGTDFADLPMWPDGLTAEVIGAYKNYLVALNTTEPGDPRPHRVLVSDSAEPGFLPTSWDHTDPAVDALDFDLSDVNAGEIQWGAPLRDVFVIYKNEATWIMRHVGGQLIMGFDPILQTSGILAKRCATPISLPLQGVQTHFVHTGQDLGTFNGQNFESVIHKRIRKTLLSSIDPINYVKSFVVDNPAQDEAWFCYPENGMTLPNMAVVWNYRTNTVTFREISSVHAATGVLESPSTLTYDNIDASITYENIGPQPYQDASRRKLVMANEAAGILLQADAGSTFNGTPFTSYVERTCLAIIGQDANGNPMLDYQQNRIIKRVWPKVRGGSCRVYIGGADQIGDAPTYSAPMTFTPGQAFNFVDPEQPYHTRLPAIKFELDEGAQIEGYDIDIEPLGDN